MFMLSLIRSNSVHLNYVYTMCDLSSFSRDVGRSEDLRGRVVIDPPKSGGGRRAPPASRFQHPAASNAIARHLSNQISLDISYRTVLYWKNGNFNWISGPKSKN